MITNPTAHDPLLTVSGLRKSFAGIVAVNDVSFSVPPGRVLSIIGPNGSGKTTTINLLSGLLRPDAGSIVLAGTQIGRRSADRIALHGARRTFQNGRVFPDLSVDENIFVGLYAGLPSVRPLPRLRSLPVLRWISMLAELGTALVRGRPGTEDRRRVDDDLARQVGRFEERLGPRRDHLAYTLSYANRRRTEIARALVSRPAVLLLDEPTAGMNQTETEEVLRQLLELKAQGQTMVIVEHKIDLVTAVSDEVVVMDGGSVIAAGDPVSVRNDERVIEAYLGRRDRERAREAAPDAGLEPLPARVGDRDA